MEQKPHKKADKGRKIFTIPNLLSLLRLCLIPAIIWLYIVKRNSLAAGCLLLLSGATDVIDGFIARRFHMVTDFGKALDPVADKLTQAAMLVCLLFRFSYMGIPLALLMIRDVSIAVIFIMLMRKTGVVPQAVWHGKAATALLYGTMLLHVFWPSIPAVLSAVLVAACTLMIGISFVLYLRSSIKLLRKKR